jgi:hypothetical protein
VIRNLERFEELCTREDFEALRKLTVEESIALGEALLTSELMTLACFRADDAPTTLAIRLGLPRRASP